MSDWQPAIVVPLHGLEEAWLVHGDALAPDDPRRTCAGLAIRVRDTLNQRCACGGRYVELHADDIEKFPNRPTKICTCVILTD
jgi:hypothetical protein